MTVKKLPTPVLENDKAWHQDIVTSCLKARDKPACAETPSVKLLSLFLSHHNKVCIITLYIVY
jgi:hypothetical protein